MTLMMPDTGAVSQVQGQPQQRSLPNIHNKDDKYVTLFFGSIVDRTFFGSDPHHPPTQLIFFFFIPSVFFIGPPPKMSKYGEVILG